MELIPLGDRVILERKRLEKIGSIYIPQERQRAYADLKCQVLAVGEGCDWGLEPGDTVLIAEFGGTWVDKDGKRLDPDTDRLDDALYVVMEEDIIAKVNDG